MTENAADRQVGNSLATSCIPSIDTHACRRMLENCHPRFFIEVALFTRQKSSGAASHRSACTSSEHSRASWARTLSSCTVINRLTEAAGSLPLRGSRKAIEAALLSESEAQHNPNPPLTTSELLGIASHRCKGQKPRSATVLRYDYLRPAALAAGAKPSPDRSLASTAGDRREKSRLPSKLLKEW